MKLKVYHCEIRGFELSQAKEFEPSSHREAEDIVKSMPHVHGREYYYGVLEDNDGKYAIDPTKNHMYNLKQNFIRVVLGIPNQERHL